MFISEEPFKRDLLDWTLKGAGPILVHTDLFRTGIPENHRKRHEALEFFSRLFLELSCKRPVLIPAFNYDFPRTGVLDLQRSPVQIGPWPDFLREQRHPRSRSPFFSMICLNVPEEQRSMIPENVFGDRSLFDWLFKSDGDLLFLGGPFNSCTMIHYIEECAQVGYRYLKNFSGKVIDGEEIIEAKVKYRVRPLISHGLDYAWEDLKIELLNEGLMDQKKLGMANSYLVSARDLHQYWLQKLEADEWSLITENARASLRQVKDKLGYPFKLEMFGS